MKCESKLRIVVYFCCAVVGIFLIIIDGDLFASFLSIICGIIIIVLNTNSVLIKSRYSTKYKKEINGNIAYFALALILIFVKNGIVIGLCGGFLVVFSAFFIICAKYKTAQVKNQLPSLFLGIFMLVVANPLLVGLLSNFIGVVLLTICVYGLFKAR